ncbi:hypothetical protein V8E53_014172, partial [Lactarius tabidus]
MRFSDIIFLLSLSIATVSAAAVDRRVASTLQNGRDVQNLNQKFQGLSAISKCIASETGCVSGQLAQCVGDKFVVDKHETRYVLVL